MFFRQLGVQLEGEGHDACWVCPEGKEAACFSRGARGDGLGFDDGDFVQRGVEEWMSSQEVGCCAADDAASCSSQLYQVGMWGLDVPTITICLCCWDGGSAIVARTLEISIR